MSFKNWKEQVIDMATDPKTKAKAVIKRLKELAESQSPPDELSKAKAASKALREETKITPEQLQRPITI